MDDCSDLLIFCAFLFIFFSQPIVYGMYVCVPVVIQSMTPRDEVGCIACLGRLTSLSVPTLVEEGREV